MAEPTIVQSLDGPGWSADVELLIMSEPRRNDAVRAIFAALAAGSEITPTTQLALVVPRTVIVTMASSQPTWTSTSGVELDIDGAGSEADALRDAVAAGDVAAVLVEPRGVRHTCVAGDIPLPANPEQTDALRQDLGLTAPTAGTGPGDDRPLVTVGSSGVSILASQEIPWDPGQALPGIYGASPVDTEIEIVLAVARLSAAEHQDWLRSWADFAAKINPVSGPRWLTLQVTNPHSIPGMRWIRAGEETTTLLGRDSAVVLVRGRTASSQAVARIAPDLQISADGADVLVRAVAVGDQSSGPDQGPPTEATYSAGSDVGWDEAFTFNGTVRPAAGAVPQLLRAQQQLTSPTWRPGGSKSLQPALLWGSMPTSGGWVTVPVPNLTPQILVDADPSPRAISATDDLTTSQRPGVLQGAAVIDNAAAVEQTLEAGQLRPQPWSVVITGASSFTATWTIRNNMLAAVTATIAEPELDLDGFVWFGSPPPDHPDLLPDLDDWVAGLDSVQLRARREPGPVTGPLTCELGSITIERSSGEPVSGRITWGRDIEILETLVGAGVLTKADKDRRPIVWQNPWAAVPTIAGVPLSRRSSSRPSPSRRLLPYEAPEPLMFTLAPGATAWPAVDAGSSLLPNDARDLNVVFLSVPGVDYSPSDSTYRFRYDLPANDERYARATITESETEPPGPLRPQDLEGHWRRLANDMALAAADDVVAASFSTVSADPVTIRHLVEPHLHAMPFELDLSTYPGALGPATTDLLDSVTGSVTLGQEGSFELVGGSMVARRFNGGSPTSVSIRDQNGDARRATEQSEAFLRTTVERSDGQDHQLTTSLRPLTVGQGWRLWFRDLPMVDGAFVRRTLDDGSPVSNNDPSAKLAENDLLSGYEWRLGDDSAGPLTFHGLHFHPLTLESVAMDGDVLASVAITGRLQLPLERGRELTELANSVTLRFTAGQRPQITVNTAGVWPLALDENGEIGGGPQLLWSTIELNGSGLRFPDLILQFYCFDVLQTVALGPSLDDLRSAAADSGQATVWADGVSVELDPGTGKHRATLRVGLDLGDLEARADIDLLAPALNAEITNARLFAEHGVDSSGLPLDKPTSSISTRSMQIAWNAASSSADLFTGMPLDTDRVAGYAAVQFTVVPASEGLADFDVEQGFVELVLPCQATTSPHNDPSLAATDPVAANLVLGSTSRLIDDDWSRTVLISGILDLSNVWSWPGSPAGGRLHHTMRAVFNQHEIPASAIEPAAGNVAALLTLAAPWHLNLVVEHRIGVLPGADPHRFTVAQAVSFYDRSQAETAMTGPEPGPLGELLAHDGPDVGPAAVAALNQLPAGAIVVDASAALWVRQDPTSTRGGAAAMQYLPVGVQTAVPTSLADYEPARWQLVTLPVLARTVPATAGPFGPDPMALIDSDDDGEQELVRLLASVPVEDPGGGPDLTPSPLDTAEGRVFARLDRVSVEADWNRLQEPPSVDPAAEQEGLDNGAMAGVLRTPVAGPARLGRPETLGLPTGGRRWSLVADDPRSASIRHEAGLRALYVFESPNGGGPPSTLPDLSGNGMDLTLHGTVTEASAADGLTDGWVWHADGLELRTADRYSPTRAESAPVSEPWATQLIENHELTIEAWVTPATASRTGPARLISLSHNHVRRVVTLGQDGGSYVTRMRTDSRDLNGIQDTGAQPSFPPVPHLQSDVLQHLVLTVAAQDDGTTLVRFYLDGQPQQDITWQIDFQSWFTRRDEQIRLMLGNEVRDGTGPGRRAWSGRFHMVGIYDRALDRGEVEQHFVWGSDWTTQGGAHPAWSAIGERLRALMEVATTGDRVHCAALQPAPDSDRQHLVVSPYLAVDLLPRPAGDRLSIDVVSSEVLCLDARTAQLTSVGSRLWDGDDWTAAGLNGASSAVQTWGGGLRRLEAPDSAIAVMRHRELRKTTDPARGEPLVITDYRFEVVNDLPSSPTAGWAAHPLRSEPSALAFAEPSFGGGSIPPDVASERAYELAPPQVTGVQPFRRLATEAGPWGDSGLRVGSRIGAIDENEPGQGSGTPGIGGLEREPGGQRWWQALQHAIRFRQGAAGLPERFAADSNGHLWPVDPDPPLPTEPVDADPALPRDPFDGWQSILPSDQAQLVLGSRAGANLAMRQQLMTQQLLSEGTDDRVSVAAGIPVQHRVPRPPPLPANDPDSKETAVRTWASAASPRASVEGADVPLDTAFAIVGEVEKVLVARLAEPGPSVDENWEPGDDGRVYAFDVTPGDDWTFGDVVRLRHGNRVWPITPGTNPGEIVASLPSGALLHLEIDATATGASHDEVLSFPLRVRRSEDRLPLTPRFLSFEDPAYNRRLATNAAQSVGNMTLLSADRRRYSPTSELYFGLDPTNPDDAAESGRTRQVVVTRRNRAGDDFDVITSSDLSGSLVRRLSAVDLVGSGGTDVEPTPVSAGDTIIIEVTVNGDSSIDATLMLPVVEDAAPPVSTAAYALLREEGGPNGKQVTVARYALSPAADRITLVDPADLKRGVVRRRAVFKWIDTVRGGSSPTYAVQKIAGNGATHLADDL